VARHLLDVVSIDRPDPACVIAICKPAVLQPASVYQIGCVVENACDLIKFGEPRADLVAEPKLSELSPPGPPTLNLDDVGAKCWGRRNGSGRHFLTVPPRRPTERVPIRLEKGPITICRTMTGRSEELDPEADTSGKARRNWAARHELVLYFALAYLLSWALWPLVILNPNSSPLVPFGPLVAAVIVALLAGGRRELWALLKQLGRWGVHPVWYVMALLGPLVMAALTAILAMAVGVPVRRTGAYTDWQAIGFFFLSTLIIVGLFEEVGWRGFALPRLQLRLDAIWAALVLGVLWALWHLPELISEPTGQRPPVQFVIWTLALSVIFSWLYNSTNGSLPIVIICHAAIDTAGRFMLPEFAGEGYQIVWWFLVALYVLVAIVVLLIGGPKRLVTHLGRHTARTARPQGSHCSTLSSC
jgi:membrane protease YdiL (CAAX protease family)